MNIMFGEAFSNSQLPNFQPGLRGDGSPAAQDKVTPH